MRRSIIFLLAATAAALAFLLLRMGRSSRLPKEPEEVLACLGQAGGDISLPTFKVKDYSETSAYDDCLWLDFEEPLPGEIFLIMDSLCRHSVSGWRLLMEHPRHHDGITPAGTVYEYSNPDADGAFETVRFYPDCDYAMMTFKHSAK